MADAIGASKDQPLRSTVWNHWIQRMTAKRLEFRNASENARRSIIDAYIQLRDSRDTQDLQLASVRQSLLDLAVAHAALARGDNLQLSGAVAAVQRELDATRALAEHFQSLKKTP